MIGWLNAPALWALPLAAIPVVIHLLRLHRSERVLFPSLRFITSSRTAAVRLRLPSDLWLLLVRIAIVVLAVTALAGPVVVTRGRLAAWNLRTARAVIVDVSESMRVAGADGRTPADAAREAAQAELKTATYGRRIDATALAGAVTRAAAWVSSAPPAKREIVVISDFQRGALDDAVTQGVAAGIGVRFVPVGHAETTRVVRGTALLGTAGGGRAQVIELSPSTTGLTLEAQRETGTPGLRFIAAPDAGAEIERLLRVVAAAGTPTGSTTQPIAFRFRGARSAADPAAPITARWMLRTVLRLRDDASLSGSTGTSTGGFGTTGADAVTTPWTPVVRDRNRAPILRAAATGNELLLDIDDAPGGLFAAATVRAALIARQAIDGYAEQEIARVDPVTLAGWNRRAADVSRDGWRTADATDARWCWGAVVMLLALEQWLRARSLRRVPVEATRVAA